MSDPSIDLRGVGKMYKIFPTRTGSVLDAIGANRFLPWRNELPYKEFWAVHDVSLTVSRGERFGIIGRNGAGKSTLLKLITGNLATTTGSVTVAGRVHALLDASGGLHPEFTGRENIRAALTYQGLGRAEIADAYAEIAEFTELGPFLDQPFRTYSTGMQARLGFAIATSLRPELLIVDEVLGAGDAYFFSKSTARMQELVDSGATVLMVSHSLNHIVRFCTESLWLERGRVVMRGPSLDVVKAYEKYIRTLEDQRLRAKNARALARSEDAFSRESYGDQILVRVIPGEQPGSECDVAELRLRVDDEVVDELLVGGTQDADDAKSSFVIVNGSHWGEAKITSTTPHRSLGTVGDPGTTSGYALFRIWFYYPESTYEVEVRYRSSGAAPMIGAGRGSQIDTFATLPPSGEWRTERVTLETGSRDEPDESDAESERGAGKLSRWTGKDGLEIESVRVLDAEGEQQTMFMTGDSLTISLEIRARTAGVYPLVLVALIFRDDGIVATRHVSFEGDLIFQAGELCEARLELARLLLGNGSYNISLGLYSSLDIDDIEPSEFYDYYDRSFEFRIVGNSRLHNELVRHPGKWTIDREHPFGDQVPERADPPGGVGLPRVSE
jgi:lipopolysaccharide transport system ATP-binding protein